MARVTLLDVAGHCGVSRATVSLVLNESPLVAANTRDRSDRP
jgi:LacI family transcriptional regulator